MQTYSLSEVSNILNVTRQAVHLQKKKGKINPIYVEGRQRYTLNEIANFKSRRYKRDHHFQDGYISTKKAAEITGTTLQRIYYLIYNKKLNAIRRNGMWFLKEKDITNCNIFGKVRGSRAERKIRRPVKARVSFKRVKALDSSKQRKKQD